MSTTLWKEKTLQARAGGGALKHERQYKLGKLAARERIDLLLDANSFEETDQLVASPFLKNKPYTDGVVTGLGTINGQRVALYAQDFTVKGGSLGKYHAQKVCKIMDLAAKIGCPIIGIIDSGGARIDEGIHALGGYGEIFFRNTRYSGVIPQISIIVGPCAGGAVYSPALTDFIFTTEKISQLFITGPQVIKLALHEDIDKESLGGTSVHAQESGVSHFVAHDEHECFEQVKQLLSYLPANYKTDPPAPAHAFDEQDAGTFMPARRADTNQLSTLVPENANQSYDIITVIEHLADRDSFFHVQRSFAANIVIGFARFDNTVVGIVANQPLVKAGALDIDASCKAARFINFCDNFSIPIVSLVDVPGFLPGIDQEHNGIIRHGAKLIAAYAQATVPKITVTLRKAYGGAYIVMGSKHLGADFNYAWPNAQIAVLGAQAAITILHGKKLDGIENEQEKITKQKELEENYTQEFLHPFVAAEHGYIDAIIEPNKTREHIIRALEITQEKVEHLPRKKHANIPL